MIESSLNICITAFSQAWAWFGQLLTASGTTGIFLAMFSAVAAYRLLVVPFMGQSFGAGSDEARKKKKED